MKSGLSKAARIALSRRGLLAGAGALAGMAALPPRVARAQGAPYPMETFFAPSRTRAVALSPSGQRIAVLEQLGTEEEPLGVIDIIVADDPEGPRRRINLGRIEAEAMEWGSTSPSCLRSAGT